MKFWDLTVWLHSEENKKKTCEDIFSILPRPRAICPCFAGAIPFSFFCSLRKSRPVAQSSSTAVRSGAGRLSAISSMF